MALMEYLKERKLASAKAKPDTTDENLFDRVSEKYKEKTPEMEEEVIVKKKTPKKVDSEPTDIQLKAISARQKAKVMDEAEQPRPTRLRDLDDRVIERLMEREKEEALRRKDPSLEQRLEKRLKERELLK